MSEPVTEQTPDDDPRAEALQAAVDRVTSYEESAPTAQIRSELERASSEAGLAVSDDVLDRITASIDEDRGPVDVRAFLD